ncbi:MAG: glycosyltransferase family 4 protein [Cyclobacteriaceae bacterium]|nr:glycosyltransferase family 4 protein [Cyclobacteriaceae bacterium]
MKILYIHQYFRTPEEGGAIRSYYLAKGMVDNGIEVEMITSHNKRYEEVKNIEGIKVNYLPVFYENELGFSKRIFSFYRFMKLVRKKAREIKNVNLCYATSTPLTIGLSALKIKKELGIPYYFEVRDLWPEAPVQLGVIKNRFVKAYLERLEKKVYKHAKKIIALSPGIKARIEQRQPNKAVELIPNMSDVEFFKPELKNPELEELFDVKDKFVVSYFGAIGTANHLEYLLAAANASLKAELPLVFFIIGVGSQTEKLTYLVKHFELTNVRFVKFQNKQNLKLLLNVTDAAYVSFANKPILETNSPNKFFDALASGKLIITNTKGWVKDICEKDHCGFYYNPDKPQDFVVQIQPFLVQKNQLANYQINSRAVGETQFSRKIQVEKLIGLVNSYQHEAFTQNVGQLSNRP